jgi:hypothetical protein
MRCATHPESEAFAICRGCFKGVCPTCAVPAGRSVACSTECAAEAARLLRMVAMSGRNASAVHRTQAAVFFVIALMTGIGAIIATDIGRWVLGIVTALMLLGAFRFLRLAAHWREAEKDQAPPR